jgi:hypothetical protein
MERLRCEAPLSVKGVTPRPRFDLRVPGIVFGSFLVAAWVLPLLPQTVLLQCIVGASVALGLAISISRKKESLPRLGVRLDNLLPASAGFLLVTAALIAPAYFGSEREIEVTLPDLFLYFLWALFQQFLIVAGFWRNLRENALLAAIAFSLAHAPNVPLMVLVLVAETVWLLLFTRLRNLFGLALAHALAAILVSQWLVPEWIRSLRVGLHYLER